MSAVRAAVHLSLLLAFIWTANEDFKIIPVEALPIPGSYLSKFVWLTIINLYLQIGYHAFAAFATIRLAKESEIVKKFHFLSSAIFFPSALTVTSLFWAMYIYDKRLLIPENRQDVFEIHVGFNHALHTLPTLAMLLDHILWNHGRVNKLEALKAIFVFSLAYIIDLHVVNAISGFWAYGIMAILPPLLRWMFILVCVLIFFCAFLVGDAFSAICHRRFASDSAKKK